MGLKQRNKKQKVFTMEEVSRHNSKDDCWLVYEDKVLDVTNFIDYHPGLPKTILRFAGKSCTDEIRQMHFDHVVDNKIPHYVIGRVSDPPKPTKVEETFRNLYKQFKAKGYFNYNDYTFYYKKLFIYFTLLFLTVSFIVNQQYLLISAVLIGVFYWQMAFIGHDLGHMSVTGDRERDYSIGLFLGNFCTGISVGWWKATHNVHHAVPNSLHSDPDIAHLPVFAVDSRMFNSIYNTYHERVMAFDVLARKIFVPFQHLLYYPIMFLARFNLYLQSFILLVKSPYAQRKKLEVLTLAGFWAWNIYLMSFYPTAKMKFLYLLLSNGFAGLLHVQITLSHFSMPVVDDFKDKSYGGDFFSRNIKSSLDVNCSKYVDWFHGGLQFQTEHHCFPRIRRNYLREAQPYIKAACLANNLPWNEMSFVDCNKDVIKCLKDAAVKAKKWKQKIKDYFNAIV
jgi:fatty acid desaturase/predicted heme/steroid binding protein